MVLQSRGRYGAFTIDELLKNQEVVVKRFSKPLVRVRWASGATIMVDGQVALILNPDNLILDASGATESRKGEAEKEKQAITKPALPTTSVRKKARQRLLVVDDSLTTRTLEKNILEAAGFQVQLAHNGVEALSFLRNNDFDLVIADLEMPEIDGFELTQNIKQDHHLGELPVIIVTSSDTPEDKARGLAAGADAYIVKSRFDQQGLLATIRQLV